MKRLLLTPILLLLLIAISWAQAPQSFKYQAVLRDKQGIEIAGEQVGVRIKLLASNTTGETIYAEEHILTSSAQGLINLNIGEGTSTIGNFAEIDWAANNYFIEVSINRKEQGFEVMGTSQLVSVPYALHAETVTDKNDADADPLNEIQDLKLVGNQLTLSKSSATVSLLNTSPWQLNEGNVFLPEGSNVGIGTDKPQGKLEIRGNIKDTPDDILFSVLNNDGDTVFAVYQGGVRVSVDDSPAKAARGGFAVASRGAAKAEAVDILNVTGDSIRIYLNESRTKAARGGFAVASRGAAKGLDGEIFKVSTDTDVDITENASKLLFYPTKDAFLAGTLYIPHPDSVGQNSANIGYRNMAKGQYSQAFGYQSIARGNYSMAVGKSAIASQVNSFAFGENAKAYGVESYAFGRGATASGHRSFAFGSAGVDSAGNATGETQAKGNYSVSIGQGSITGISFEDCPPKPSKFSGTQLDYYNLYYSGKGAVAIGVGDSSLASYAVTIGYFNTAKYGSVALGYNNKANGNYAVISGGAKNSNNGSSSFIGGGQGNLIDDIYAVVSGGEKNKVREGAPWGAILGGYSNEVSGSTASIIGGTYNSAIGAVSCISGSRNTAYSCYETVVGRFNAYNSAGNSTDWISSDNLFVIGNGTSDASRSNAMVVSKNGNTKINGNLTVTGSIIEAKGSSFVKPDYVFKDDYSNYFNPLEVETFIKQNGHLPWLTKDTDETEGINLTRMQFETVETVENLQLQIINQQSEIEVLKAEIEAIKALINK